MANFHPTYREQSPESKLALHAVNTAAAVFNEALDAYVHPSREKSLAVTKLEECVMWAVEGITN